MPVTQAIKDDQTLGVPPRLCTPLRASLGPPPRPPPQEGLGLSPPSLRLLLWGQGPPGDPLPAPSVGGLVWRLSWPHLFPP